MSTTTTLYYELVKGEIWLYNQSSQINDIKRLDDFLDAVNIKLGVKGFFFCCVETRIRGNTDSWKISSVVELYLLFFRFIVKRILPKLKFTRDLSFLTRGENAVPHVPKHWEDFPGQDSELSRSHSSETSCALRQGSIMNPSVKWKRLWPW